MRNSLLSLEGRPRTLYSILLSLEGRRTSRSKFPETKPRRSARRVQPQRHPARGRTKPLQFDISVFQEFCFSHTRTLPGRREAKDPTPSCSRARPAPSNRSHLRGCSHQTPDNACRFGRGIPPPPSLGQGLGAAVRHLVQDHLQNSTGDTDPALPTLFRPVDRMFPPPCSKHCFVFRIRRPHPFHPPPHPHQQSRLLRTAATSVPAPSPRSLMRRNPWPPCSLFRSRLRGALRAARPCS